MCRGSATRAELARPRWPRPDRASTRSPTTTTGRSRSAARAAGPPGTTPEDALSEEWLARTDATLAFYTALRDEFEPGKPIWLTETADAACGGNPWGASFLDTFRYLDQLGRLAKQGVQVVAHNTLVASDYGLLDERTLAPRPELLGGAAVADAHGHDGARQRRSPSKRRAARLRALSQRHARRCRDPASINTDKAASQTLRIPTPTSRYTLELGQTRRAAGPLNGSELTWDQKGDLPRLAGASTAAGDVDARAGDDQLSRGARRVERRLPLGCRADSSGDQFAGMGSHSTQKAKADSSTDSRSSFSFIRRIGLRSRSITQRQLGQNGSSIGFLLGSFVVWAKRPEHSRQMNQPITSPTGKSERVPEVRSPRSAQAGRDSGGSGSSSRSRVEPRP